MPRDTANFTGRQAELTQLLDGIDSLAAGGGVVGICAIDGMAGIGKTTFAVHAAHELAPGFPDGQFFLPLHAHAAGQRPVESADALASLLLTAGLAPQQIPPGVEAQAARWRGQVAGKKVLLLLDDAASHEQVRPLLPGTAGSLVLVTSRCRLSALEGAAVGELTRLCGYLPLAIGMLASQLRHHAAWSAAELAAGLAEARDRLALMRAENLSVAAAFGLSYADTLAGLVVLQGDTGDYPAAAASLVRAVALYGDAGDLSGQGHALNHLAYLHVLLGVLLPITAGHQDSQAE